MVWPLTGLLFRQGKPDDVLPDATADFDEDSNPAGGGIFSNSKRGSIAQNLLSLANYCLDMTVILLKEM